MNSCLALQMAHTCVQGSYASMCVIPSFYAELRALLLSISMLLTPMLGAIAQTSCAASTADTVIRASTKMIGLNAPYRSESLPWVCRATCLASCTT